jgi:hypothetical protein
MPISADDFCRRLAIARQIGLTLNVPSASVQNEIISLWIDGQSIPRAVGVVEVTDTLRGEVILIDRYWVEHSGCQILCDLPKEKI